MSSAVAVSANTLKLAIPIGAGVISLAYLCAKLFNNENARTEYENEKVIEKSYKRRALRGMMSSYMNIMLARSCA